MCRDPEQDWQIGKSAREENQRCPVGGSRSEGPVGSGAGADGAKDHGDGCSEGWGELARVSGEEEGTGGSDRGGGVRGRGAKPWSTV